jgi:hypothetical protein
VKPNTLIGATFGQPGLDSQLALRFLEKSPGIWEGRPLGKSAFVISADEKTSIQARIRVHPTVPTAPHQSLKVEHEYDRCGVVAYSQRSVKNPLSVGGDWKWPPEGHG